MGSSMSDYVNLHLGVKSDPIEYRYSWEWLIRILADEGIGFVQIGTFFEIYHLPDSALLRLRETAERYGVQVSSIFTAHRELGGFFQEENAWHEVAFRNYQRLIEIGALLGAGSVGSNPGAILRDQMHLKHSGIRNYISAMKGLMHHAASCGVKTLAIEPMSCLAEPPTLPAEMSAMAEELRAYHSEYQDTASIGYCFDISHGYVDETRRVRHTSFELLDAALPYITEVHLKNTDALHESTFGFTPVDRERGIIDVESFRNRLLADSARLPVRDLVGYFEIGGPKLGRDYSDCDLEKALRTSIRYLREAFSTSQVASASAPDNPPIASCETRLTAPGIRVAPSMMCADMSRLRDDVQELEALGIDLLHWDIMDAHFVPNLPCGLALLERMRGLTSLPFDVHLMVENNDFFVAELAKIGVQMISVHYESARHSDRTLSFIRESGAQAGIALNPATPPAVLEYLTHLLDFVLVMTVNPGFAGQKLSGSGLAKIAGCKDWLKKVGLTIPIEVDGNVSFDYIPEMVRLGADILVAGTSSLFSRSGTARQNMQKLRTAAAKGMKARLSVDERVPELPEMSISRVGEAL